LKKARDGITIRDRKGRKRSFSTESEAAEDARVPAPHDERSACTGQQNNDFDMPWRIQTGQGTEAAETRLEYEAGGTRVIKREDVLGGIQQTTYIAELYERVTRDGPQPLNRYRIFAGSRPVAQVTRTGSNPVSDTVQYLHDDHLGSTSVVIDADGDSIDTRSFGPFGQTEAFDEDNVINGFTGHEHDREQGLINMRGRLYDPAIGRFLTADPYVTNPLNSQGWNRYAYVENNPLNFVDPSGFGPKDCTYNASCTEGQCCARSTATAFATSCASASISASSPLTATDRAAAPRSSSLTCASVSLTSPGPHSHKSFRPL
jgi:RHS repeat-associated protein